MAGRFKRSGSRGGGGGTSGFKKGYAKRHLTDDGDNAPHAIKKSKVEEEDGEESDTPVEPKLQTDEEDNQFIAVCSRSVASYLITHYFSSTTAAKDASQSATSKA